MAPANTYISMDQPWVYICLLLLQPPSHFPPQITPLVLHSTGLNSLRNSTLPLATCFTRGNACDSTLLSHFFHPLLPTLCPQAVLYVCICIQFSSVQLSHSVASSFLWPHGLQHARLPCPSPTPGACSNSRPLSRWCHPTISSSVIPFSSYLPSIRVFSNEFVLHIRWPKYWSLSFSISPSNECSGLISFRMDWLDLLAVQGTLKSLLQHYSSKASIPWHSAFFMVQLSHPYMTTRKTVTLTRWTFVGEVMSLLFNMLSRLVITFLPRSKCLLISWLQSLSTVTLDPKKIKSVTVYPPIHHGVMGPDAMILVFWKLSFKPDFLPLFFHFH